MKWNMDPAHSEILFTTRHMMISKVRGQFEKFNVNVNLDLENPQNTTVEAAIEAASLNTRDAQRDGHLKSPDFLDAANFPNLTFRSTKITPVDARHAKLTGDLTMRGVTRPVTLDVEFTGMAKSPWGATSAGFGAWTTLRRSDWNLTWNVALETGGWLISDEIEISIQLELVQQPEAERASADA
jgi:polyisoprenoid-binding protein YceI